jgi:glycosyltransferase involved in cell wall biosynthesis
MGSDVSPRVSFVVPCYRLAHYLRGCVESILSQTFESLEVLIMDDCSPDETEEVARSFYDPRVRYIRNEVNLRHLANYNKGIALAKGKYIWLISADDQLRRPYVLQRYVELMDRDPRVGYAYCAGIGVYGDKETGLVEWAFHGDRDAIFAGHEMFCRLLERNSVLAPSGLVRSECYQRHGSFPLDLPYAGDWYLWLLFALHHDVAYFAEPMVNYRQHALSMTNTLSSEDARICSLDELAVLWRIRGKAADAGHHDLAARAKKALFARALGLLLNSRRISAKELLTLDDFLEFMAPLPLSREERHRELAHVYAALADQAYCDDDRARAAEFYRQSLQNSWRQPGILAKSLLLRIGPVGAVVRHGIGALKRRGTLHSAD